MRTLGRTTRKRNEGKKRSHPARAKLAVALREYKEAVEQQAATAEILEVIAGSPSDLRPVFETILSHAIRLCEGFNAILWQYDGEKLRFAAEKNCSAQGIAHHRENPLPLGGYNPTPQAALERRIVHVLDVFANPQYRPLIPMRNPKAATNSPTVLAVPLLRDGELLGVISIWRREARLFSKRQVAMVKTLASQAVIAIENVRLFNETKEALEQQTATSEILRVISRSPSDMQPVFDSILEHAMRLCDAGLGTVGLYDGKTYKHRAQRGGSAEYVKRLFDEPFVPHADGTLGRMIAEGRPVHIPDYRKLPAYRAREPRAVATVELGGARTYLAVPMLKDGRVLGGITIRRSEVRPFTQKQIDLLSTFASQAVIAIENVRLFNETREALEQQTATSEILGVISRSPTDLRPVFDAILRSALKLCEAHLGLLNLYDGERLRTVAQRGGDAELAAWVVERGAFKPDGAAADAIAQRCVVHIADAKQLAAYREGRANFTRFVDLGGARTFLAVPLLKDDKVVGNIGIYRPEVRPFTEKQIALVGMFANQAVIAIENVRLFNETKEALEHQTATSEILGVISGMPSDAAPVFQAIARSGLKLFDGAYVTVLRRVGDQIDLAAVTHSDPERARRSRELYPVPLSREYLTGKAILDGTLTDIADSEHAEGLSPTAAALLRKLGYRAITVAPMLRGDTGIGAIAVARDRPGALSDKQIALLKTFADQAVIAIENVRLFKEIQEKSAQLEVANQHKSEFLANMSHELRTPLNAVIGFSEALMEKMFGEVNEKQADYLKDIHESGKHLLSLINDILDLSKIEAGRMELDVSTFHLPSALSNAMTLIRERAQRHAIALGLDVDQALGEFRGDERKFRQIMLNLLSNAVKFTPDGGKVDVSARKHDGRVEVAVRDTGIGIAPEDQALVFEEFRQVGRDQMRKAEGTGLGLALTKRFVELHGGALRLDSAPGKGSTFSFTLPVR